MKFWPTGASSGQRIWLFCDGGAGGIWPGAAGEEAAQLPALTLQAGCGAVARSDSGAILEWSWRPLASMTNNEAEYAGLLLGLELAMRLRPQTTVCVLDSATVVWQMQGRSAVHSAALRRWHRQACSAAQQLPNVIYRLIPRELNCLADALARQARFPWPAIQQVLEGT